MKKITCLSIIFTMLFSVTACSIASQREVAGLTDEDLEQLDYVCEALDDVRNDSDYESKDEDEQMEDMLDAINALADEGMIDGDSILCDREELYITFEYGCGVLGAETFGENDETCSMGDSYISNSIDDMSDEVFVSSEHMGTALILDALVDRSDEIDVAKAGACVNMAENWRNQGIDTRIDYTVTLDDLSHISRCDILLIFMHGNYLDYRFQGKIPMMRLEQEVTSETSRDYQDDLDNNCIVIKGGHYAVTPKFFEEHYSSDESNLNGTYLFLASCNQMGVDDENCEQWSDIIPQTGISAMIAFHDEPLKYYATDLANIFIGRLLLGETAMESYEASVDMYGGDSREYCTIRNIEYTESGSPGVPIFRGDPNSRLNFVVEVDAQVSQTEPSEQRAWIRDGDHIIFGHYEQDGNQDNGMEPIEWDILSEEDGRILVISRYILDSQPYNVVDEEITWENCSLRTWLNNDFLNIAFSPEEQSLIQATTLSNPDNTYFGIDGGNDTVDRVFCLSVDEALQYYNEYTVYSDDPWYFSQSFMAEVTQYAIDNDARYDVISSDRFEGLVEGPMYNYLTEDVIGCRWGIWWLRSPGGISYINDDPDYPAPFTNACYVSELGDLGWTHCFNDVDTYLGVRPAIWLNTSNQTEPSQNTVVQNASQGLVFEEYFDDEDSLVPLGSAMVCGIGTCTDSDIVIPSVAPNGMPVAVIEDFSFEYCDSIETVVIPDSVVRIMNNAFTGCENLNSVTLPDSIRVISSNAFSSCHSLESIVIPEGVEVIRSNTFGSCTSLRSVTLPNSLREIYHDAFNNCTSLENIVIPQGVEVIGPGAFADCTSLTSLTIPEGAVVSSEAFTGSGIQTINGIDAQTWIAQNCVDDMDD